MILRFPTDLCGIPGHTGPHSLAILGSSSHELGPLFRVHSYSAPVRFPQRPDSSPGVGTLHRGMSSRSPLSNRFPKACLGSAHSVSHAHDGLLLPEPCELVSSHYHVRDSLFRGFPQQPANLIHHQLVPSCRWQHSPATRLPHSHQIPLLRLQGLDPTVDPFLIGRFFTPANAPIPS
jgi:hypothetical protein